MTRMNKSRLSSAILAAISFGSMNQATAGEESLILEEVIITAERRSQTLQEIPLAVSAVSGDKIERAQITRTDDMTSLAPGLQISSGRLGEQKVVIRGVGGSARDNIAASPKVAMFIDDVYVSRGAAMDMAFFDLDRVEVLRGPQGTLYGKNAIAGAINVHSRAPSDEFEAKLSATVGNYGAQQTRFMVSGPLADSLYGKVVGGTNDRDGFTDNLTTGNELSVEESRFARATILFEGESWDLRAIMDYEHNPSNPGTALHINSNDSGTSTTGFQPLAIDPTTVSSPNDRYEVTIDEDGEGSQTNQGFSFKASYSGDNFDFDSITGYRDITNSFTRDIDNTDSSLSGIGITNDAEDDSWSVSQEFRISSVDGGAFTMGGDLFWTAGLYLFHDVGERQEVFSVDIAPFGFSKAMTQSMDLEGNTIALYGQGTYTVNDQLDIIFGLRYSYETKEAKHSLVNGIFEFGLTAEEAFTDVEIDESWTQLSPKLTANYQLTDEVMMYATYSKGSLGGGFNFGPASAVEAASASFDQEGADNFEVGVKGSAWDSRLQYTVSAFYIDYQDLQVQGVNAAGAATTNNAANATSQGIELELTALVAEGLTLSANYAYVDATFDSYCEQAFTDNGLSGAACLADADPSPGAPQPIDNEGNQLEYSSEHVFNFSAEYIMPLAESGDLIFATNYNYSSEQFFNPSNTSGQDSYGLIDASVAFESADGNWFVSLWGKNLSDEGYNVDFIDYGRTTDGAAYVQGAPRTYGATVTWTY